MTLPDIDYPASTALVTGATSGIGLAIAHELVSRRIGRLILVSKTAANLTTASTSLRQAATAALEVRTITADLIDRTATGTVAAEIASWGWHVDLLVNNAGFARKEVFAADRATDTALDSVDLLVRAPVDLMLQFLPAMVERRSGGILNLGSTAGYQPVPYTAAYAAAKAFLMSFSMAIREENIDKGVRVACVVPGITETNLDGQGHGERRGMLDSVGIDTPENVAKQAIDTLEKNWASNVLGWNNKALKYATTALPDAYKAAFVAKARGAPEQ